MSATDPNRIGSFSIEHRLGEGSFGTVYLAREIDGLDRDVALKVLRPGRACERVRARFAVERQALALMDHEFIARIYEAGESEGGAPFFAMEFVDGSPITEYCKARELGVAARLELFVKVCKAVQHAHQKGVIHRDIKPSNGLGGGSRRDRDAQGHRLRSRTG